MVVDKLLVVDLMLECNAKQYNPATDSPTNELQASNLKTRGPRGTQRHLTDQ